MLAGQGFGSGDPGGVRHQALSGITLWTGVFKIEQTTVPYCTGKVCYFARKPVDKLAKMFSFEQ